MKAKKHELFLPMPSDFKRPLNSPAGNFSLFFNKGVFFKGTPERPEGLGSEKLQEFHRLKQRYEESQQVLRTACEKWQKRRNGLVASLLDQEYSVITCEARTLTPLVTGLGLEHPLENSFVLDRTTGLPYLPATGIKGISRFSARFDKENMTLKNDDDVSVVQPFGAQDSRGSVLFFDGIPTHVPSIKVDIMNPHYPKYYETKGKHPASEDQDPNPIPFLVLEEGSEFEFTIASRDARILKQAETFLKEALTFWGIGAKTAVGYGLMEILEQGDAIQLESDVQESSGRGRASEELESRSPLDEAFEELRLRPAPERFAAYVKAVDDTGELDHLEKAGLTTIKGIDIGYATKVLELDISETVRRTAAKQLLTVFESQIALISANKERQKKKKKLERSERYEKLKELVGKRNG
ncbi:MAG: type III-B CRISPR module RAMP protein Cmr6 [Syntrophobacteria bacterium]